MSNGPYWLSHTVIKKGLQFELSSTCAGGWSWTLEAKGPYFNTLLFSEEYTTKYSAHRGMMRFALAIRKAVREESY